MQAGARSIVRCLFRLLFCSRPTLTRCQRHADSGGINISVFAGSVVDPIPICNMPGHVDVETLVELVARQCQEANGVLIDPASFEVRRKADGAILPMERTLKALGVLDGDTLYIAPRLFRLSITSASSGATVHMPEVRAGLKVADLLELIVTMRAVELNMTDDLLASAATRFVLASSHGALFAPTAYLYELHLDADASLIIAERSESAAWCGRSFWLVLFVLAALVLVVLCAMWRARHFDSDLEHARSLARELYGAVPPRGH